MITNKESIGRMATEVEEENSNKTQSHKENRDKVNYKLCCLYNEQQNKCGPYNRPRCPKSGLVSVQNLNAEIENHLRNLHFKNSIKIFRWNERKLIENRIGMELEDYSVI